MKVSKYINTSIGALLITIRKCQIGSYGYDGDVIFKVIDKSGANTDNIKIQDVSGTLRAVWVDIGTDERRKNYRLRFLYKNEVKKCPIS